MKKNFFVTLITFTFFSANLYAFGWPIENIKQDSFKTYFGQNLSKTISSALIFKKETEQKKSDDKNLDAEKETRQILASEDGELIGVLFEYEDDNDFFPSTLGNTKILSRANDILTVYANINLEDDDKNKDETFILAGTPIGTEGNTAWHESDSSLIFFVLDTKSKSAINPRIHLPRIEKENSFAPTEIIVESREGKRFELKNIKSLSAGTYRFYQKRNEKIVPQKISLSVNGEPSDEYNFDMILQNGKSIFVNGQGKRYGSHDIYPDDTLLLIGEVRLTQGKSVLTFENTNYLGEKRLSNFTLTIY